MKAVYLERFGGPEVLVYGERPDPTPAPGEALVRVRACAVNHLDLWVRGGLPGLTPEMPHILGNDIVGEVVAVGAGVTSPRVGERTLVLPTLSCGACPACAAGDDHLCRAYDVIGRRRNGGYAELVSVPAANCLPYPANLTWEQAAAVPLVTVTAWHMLVTRAHVRAGEDVLVIGAGSGVGSAAIAIARLHGARVIATAGGEAKCARARELGAHEVIDHTREDLAARVRELTGRKGVEVVVEHVGGSVFEAAVASLARDGRLVTCGATIGSKVTLDINTLFGRHLSLLGSWMGRRDDLTAALVHVASGAIAPVVDEVLPLAEARRAHERIEAREHFGKVVLVP
jgi:NADPH:quinone reductase-like Zn-dependent oxidoreductase